MIYCVGVTSDFRERPFDTVEGHVCLLERVLRESRSESVTYLSSARVYGGGRSPAREDDALWVSPIASDNLYVASRVMGESLTLTGHPRGRVVRLSHAYGPDFASETFLPAVLREVVATGQLTLRSDLDSRRDFVNVRTVVARLIDIATRGRERIYNVASGRQRDERRDRDPPHRAHRLSGECRHPGTSRGPPLLIR